MQTQRKQPKHEAKIDMGIRQDAELRSAFEFWVRSIYLERRGAPHIVSCDIATMKENEESPAPVSSDT